MVEKIDKSCLTELVFQAKGAERKRKNYNYHKSFNDPINRMLNAIEPGSYIQPHKHENPDKREVFLLLQGKLAVVLFDNQGNISDHVILDNKEYFGIEIPPSTWHTLIAMETGTVFYEIKDGPYAVANDKNFAGWAPKEGDETCGDYLNGLLTRLKIY